MSEQRIHIEEPRPPCCSACYQPADQELRYVDLGASTDGPVTSIIPEGAIGVVGHVIDEIILCETCIRTAGKLVGLGNAEELLAEVEQLNETIDTLHAQAASTRDGIDAALDHAKGVITGAVPPPNGNSLIPGQLPAVPKRRARKKAAAK